MQLSEMIDEVSVIVQDSSFTSSTIAGYINQALMYTCARVMIPELKRRDTLTIAGDSISTSLTGLTGGFSGIMSRVIDSAGNAVKIMPDLDALLDEYPGMDATGSLEAVAIEGNLLWSQKVSSDDQDVTCYYYRLPETLAEATDSPSELPEHLHRPLLVHGASWMIFDMIEDDIDGKKVNATSNFWLSLSDDNRHSGITKLREWIGQRKRHFTGSVWRY